MKFLALLTVLLGSSAFAAQPQTCGKIEQKKYVMTIEQFYVGEVTRIDVGQAQMEYLAASHTCAAISKVQYCYEVLPVARLVTQGMEEEMKVGQRTNADVIDAQAKELTLVGWCK